MSKDLHQPKITSFLSQPNSVEKRSEVPSLKRKLSDSAAEGNMGDKASGSKKSYAKVTASSSPGAYVSNRKNSDSQNRDQQNNNRQDNKYNKVRTERAALTPQYQSSSGFERSRHDSDSDRSHDSHEDAHTFSTSEDSSFKVEKPEQGCSKDRDVEHVSNKGNKPKVSPENTSVWRGVPIESLKRAPECFRKAGVSLPPLKTSLEHKVFFEVPAEGWNASIPKPFVGKRQDSWDDAHVYMPHHESNRMPENGHTCSRSERIVQALSRSIPSSFELEDAILSYNPHYKRRWNFDSLHRFFEESKEGSQIKDEFFVTILPKMQVLALQLNELCPTAIPILKQGKSMKLTFSQQQVACLLANAFFCTFPKRNFKSKYCLLPDINFSNLFGDTHGSRKIEKLSCIINYFRRVINDMPNGTVTYARQHITLDQDWPKMDKKFSNLHVSTSGTIEDDGKGMLQADFANKYVGGGVLGHGLVQEEIRFVICPEMILSRLFTEALTDKEVLIMTGCERYSTYDGYSDTFKYSGNYVDQTDRDEWGRRYTEVVAMDALVFSGFNGFKSQFEKDKMFREMNKAYCAFKGNQFTSHLPAVCTGNWGCGAFGGDKQLKAMIQWMAASAVDRDVCYFTFGDSKLRDQLGQLYHMFQENDIQVSNVLGFIKRFHDDLKNAEGKNKTLFQHLAKMLGETLQEPYTAEEINSQDVGNSWDVVQDDL